MPTHQHLVEPPRPFPTSPRAIAVATHFGVLDSLVPATRTRRLPSSSTASTTRTRHRKPIAPDVRASCNIAAPAAGSIMLLTGGSGSGKSSLLRSICRGERSGNRHVLNLRQFVLPQRPVVDCFDDLDPDLTRLTSPRAFAPILKRLARVGLAEVWTWLRLPSQLSEGQRWRLRLALAMQAVDSRLADDPTTHTLLVCDEFAALLDRVTAFVVAGVLRRFVDTRHDRVAAIVATSHDDLRGALDPDVIATCDFGHVSVRRRKRQPIASHAKPETDAD